MPFFWIDGSSENRMIDSFMQIAETVSQKTMHDFRLAKSLCQDWFRNNSTWLLIADNPDEEKMIESFQEGFMRGGMGGGVLVTSTNATLASHWDSLEVGDMAMGEGRRLLQKIIWDENSSLADNNPEERTDLVNELGGHPLAIDQVGCYM
jgi:hypothetical protein